MGGRPFIDDVGLSWLLPWPMSQFCLESCLSSLLCPVSPWDASSRGSFLLGHSHFIAYCVGVILGDALLKMPYCFLFLKRKDPVRVLKLELCTEKNVNITHLKYNFAPMFFIFFLVPNHTAHLNVTRNSRVMKGEEVRSEACLAWK